MLARWTLRNFKSYSAENSLVLSPLTLLCGANSSGKSSVLQSMLLIKQTLEHSPADRVVALNGPLVQLGTFSDILNDQALVGAQEIGIGWDIDHARNPIATNHTYLHDFQVVRSCLDFVFDAIGPVDDRATLELQPGLRSARTSAAITDGAGEEHDVRVAIERVTGRGRRIQYDSSTLADDGKLRFRIAEIDPETREAAGPGHVPSKVVGASINHFSPSALIVRYDRNLQMAKQAAIALTGAASFSRFRMAPLRLSTDVRKTLQAALKSVTTNTRYESISRLFEAGGQDLTIETIAQRFREVSPTLRRVARDALAPKEGAIAAKIHEELGVDRTVSLARVEQLARVASASDHYFRFLLRYLGPLRADPRPLYPLQALGSPTDVGPKGEQTAAVLHLNAKRKIRTIAASSFRERPQEATAVETTLAAAVADWLAYLGVAEDFETIEKGKLGHELRVRTPGTTDFQDLTNVGVGVSQVLPIVVTCLLAPIGSTIILEQPELHLHPAVQARIADFFIAMIMLKKQCIVETHSEHLIERIRFRVAQDLSNSIHGNTKIYFFSKEMGRTSVNEVAVNRYGSIDDWPKDFFDQSQIANEEIVLMALQRRKAEREHPETARGAD